MSTFKVLPIKNEIAQEIREKMVDQNVNQLSVSIAVENSYGPCRSCLRQFKTGERRIVFSYSPNPIANPYNETGPIYIHADECEPYKDADVFPPEVENGRIKFPLAFRAYNKNGMMIDGLLPNGERPGETIEALFENENIAFVHVRNRQVGCFIAHVDRAAEETAKAETAESSAC